MLTWVSVSTWDIVKQFLLSPFLSFIAFSVRSDLDVWRQLPVRPEGVPEHTDVTYQHLFTEDPVYCVPDLSEIRALKMLASRRISERKKKKNTQTPTGSGDPVSNRSIKQYQDFETLFVIQNYMEQNNNPLQWLLIKSK